MKPNDIRWMARFSDENIPDSDLEEIIKNIPLSVYLSEDKYEYSGNFIITKDLKRFKSHLDKLCCGIITHEINTSSGTIYFAFDYGH